VLRLLGAGLRPRLPAGLALRLVGAEGLGQAVPKGVQVGKGLKEKGDGFSHG